METSKCNDNSVFAAQITWLTLDRNRPLNLHYGEEGMHRKQKFSSHNCQGGLTQSSLLHGQIGHWQILFSAIDLASCRSKGSTGTIGRWPTEAIREELLPKFPKRSLSGMCGAELFQRGEDKNPRGGPGRR